MAEYQRRRAQDPEYRAKLSANAQEQRRQRRRRKESLCHEASGKLVQGWLFDTSVEGE